MNASVGFREAEQDWSNRTEVEGGQQDQLIPLHVGQCHISAGGRPLNAHPVPELQTYQTVAGLSWGELQNCHGVCGEMSVL